MSEEGFRVRRCEDALRDGLEVGLEVERAKVETPGVGWTVFNWSWTNPASNDTDADGLRDGQEDRNLNG